MPDPREILRREGLTSYLDAMMAIDEFNRLIQEDCRRILDRQANALQQATGLKFSPKEITAYSEPYKGGSKLWTGQFASISALMPVRNSAKFHSLDVGIDWEYKDGKTRTRCSSCIYTNSRAFLGQLSSNLNRPELEVDNEYWALVLWGESPPRF